jgi:hypothetical protein
MHRLPGEVGKMPFNQETEMEDWIKKLTSGTQDAWDEFITCFNRLIYKVFWTRSFGFSREEIDELFHDFLVSMMENNYKKVRLFEGRNNCSFASYLSHRPEEEAGPAPDGLAQ